MAALTLSVLIWTFSKMIHRILLSYCYFTSIVVTVIQKLLFQNRTLILMQSLVILVFCPQVFKPTPVCSHLLVSGLQFISLKRRQQCLGVAPCLLLYLCRKSPSLSSLWQDYYDCCKQGKLTSRKNIEMKYAWGSQDLQSF